MKSFVSNSGYLRNTLTHKGKKFTVTVHRLVADEYISNPQNKPEINHIDGNKLNNDTSNLEWCTHKENKQHASANDLVCRGSNRPFAKLKENQVSLIKDIYRGGELKIVEIAYMFGVSASTISLIIHGKSWKHVQ